MSRSNPEAMAGMSEWCNEGGGEPIGHLQIGRAEIGCTGYIPKKKSREKTRMWGGTYGSGLARFRVERVNYSDELS
jgi:hypothetical protein